MQLDNFLDKIKSRAKDSGGKQTEWSSIVGELTDFLNKDRGNYKPLVPGRVAQLISYIKKSGGYGDLRVFRDDVLKKGSWYFWYIVKPKK